MNSLMTRRVPRIVLGLAVLGVLAAPARFAARAPEPASSPNILFILADDLDAAAMAFMPKLKALLTDQGVSFPNYFVSVSLCCPSRSTTLRGQYSHNSGIRTNGGGNGGFETAYATGLEKSTIATWLQSAGYRTALYGKYLNGYPHTAPSLYVPPGWTDWASAIAGNAYSEYNYALNEHGARVPYGAGDGDYGTDVYARKAAAFVRKAATDATPFFVYLAVYAPHAPATPAPRHAALFPNARAPRTPSFDEADVSDKPDYIRNRPRIGPLRQDIIDQLYRKRLQSLQAVDDAVAALVDTLKATGQLARTFIVFASDNGFHLGQHRMLTGKQTAYEEDIRVPLIVRGPGVPAGAVVPNFAANVDLAPTFAEIGGAKTPEFVDGRSLVPLLGRSTSSVTEWRQVFLVEHWQEQPATASDSSREPVDADQARAAPLRAQQRRLARVGGGGRAGRAGIQRAAPNAIPEFHALRTPQYTYVEYVTGERELYDLARDPFELVNVAATSEPALLASLSRRLHELAGCAAAACRRAEARRIE